MTEIGRSILLGAEIEKIYAVLTDATQIPDWFEHITGISVTNNFQNPMVWLILSLSGV